MEEPLLQHRDERGVVALTLNRRQALNALSEAMLAALGKAFDAMATDEPVRAVVLGASGKALFYRRLEQGIESAYEDAGATMACNMMDPSALEGVQAFIDKRVPNWVAGQA
jgi:enoyl-CoA hydratase/carnithine racemase